jgi:hypothetical protein
MFDMTDVIAGFLDWPAAAIAAIVALAIVIVAPRQARAVVLWFAQYASFLALLLVAIAAGRQGYVTGGAIGRAHELNELGQFYYSVAGAGLGALAGLTVGALVVAMFFVLLEIRDNTKG